MLFVGTSIIHPSTEGVFLLCNILDLLIYSFFVFFDTYTFSMLCFYKFIPMFLLFFNNFSTNFYAILRFKAKRMGVLLCNLKLKKFQNTLQEFMDSAQNLCI